MDYNKHTEALKMQLHRLSDLMRDVMYLLEHSSFEEFRQNEDLKERAYFELQEIGQTAMEMQATVETDDPIDLPLEPLTALGNAQYNQEQEVGHQQVYYVIKNDFPVMRESIMHMLDKFSKET